MAINIFSGGSGGSKVAGKATKTSKPVEVQTVTGKTATSGIKKVIGTVGSIAEKYGNLIPGVGGIVSSIGKIFSKNDPEWWQNVPGTGVSTNIPLSNNTWEQSSENSVSISAVSQISAVRPAILEFTGKGVETDGTFSPIIRPTDSMISTYLMQNIRKVVNAIPLQAPGAYKEVLTNQVTAYALKHQLDKFISLTTNGKPYLPSLTDGSYQILDATNYATLVSFRDRLSEYCKASVRLPHTMCQYLAWRYGRIFRTGTSDKCALVIYDVVPLAATLEDYKKAVNHVLGYVAAAEVKPYFGVSFTPIEKQAAQADIFNAYLHHVMDVNIALDTQFQFDPKEFVLRTNLDTDRFIQGGEYSGLADGCVPIAPSPEYIYMDSALDNKTTFMASTVSTAPTGGEALFPVNRSIVHATGIGVDDFSVVPSGGSASIPLWSETIGAWCYFDLWKATGFLDKNMDQSMAIYVGYAAALAKSLEYYNAEIYIPYAIDTGGKVHGLDMTAMSQDLARVTDDVIANTQVYAFANLVYDGVTSYAAKEMPAAIAASESAVKQIVDNVTPANVTPV